MLTESELSSLRQIARGIAAHFGSNCEVVIHNLQSGSTHSIDTIENGHVTGRKIGDVPSQIVLEQLAKQREDPQADDHYCYLTKTPNGKILKSSSMYIRDEEGDVAAIFSINFDISALSLVQSAVSDLIAPGTEDEVKPLSLNVHDLLDELLRQSEELVGKPASMMNKDEKIRAIAFLNRSGAMLITKSGEKISKYFGISKYTLYSYLDMKQEEEKND